MSSFTLVASMFAVLAGVALLSLLLWRDLRMYRSAGIGDAQPACGKCRHLMRGWSSPNCPECGSDVRVAGIVTGSSRARALAGQIAVLVAVAAGLVGFAVAHVAASEGQQTVTSAQVGRVSAVEPSLSASLTARAVGRRAGGVREVSGELVLKRAGAADGTADAGAAVSVALSDRADVPGLVEIRAALDSVAGDALDASQLDAHARALADIVESAKMDPMAPVVERPWRSIARRTGIVSTPVSVGLGFLAVPVIVLLIGAVLTDRWFPRPRREPRDGEWAS